MFAHFTGIRIGSTICARRTLRPVQEVVRPMSAVRIAATGSFDGDDPLFLRIAAELTERSYSVIPNAVPAELGAEILAQIQGMPRDDFNAAGVGRDDDHTLNHFVRRDSIRWIAGTTAAERSWLSWAGRLQTSLNRQLFLGLSEFESHFAHYAPGDFYRKHLDAFKSDRLAAGIAAKSNRVLSLVAYFNPGWLPDDGGELLIYDGDNHPLLQVTPAYSTLVVFLSEEVPHEVLPSRRDRYSIAGWFRN
jgi:SM-20-related protein